MVITERFRRVAENIIQYQATYDDPVTYEKPFTVSFPLTPLDGGVLLPYDCHPGNTAISMSLSAERFEDRRQPRISAKGINRPRRSVQDDGAGVGAAPPGADAVAARARLNLRLEQRPASETSRNKKPDLRSGLSSLLILSICGALGASLPAQTTALPTTRLLSAPTLAVPGRVDSSVPMTWTRIDGQLTLVAFASWGGAPMRMAARISKGCRSPVTS